MKKFVLLIIAFLFLSTTKVFAADNPIPAADVSEYSIKIKKVELCTNTLACTTVFEGDSGYLDIASVNAGAAVGDIISGVIPPAGTYSIVRTTVDNEFRIEAQYNDGGTVYYTNSQAVAGGHTVATTTTIAASQNPVVNIIDFSVIPGVTLYNNDTADGIYRNASGDLIHIMNVSPFVVGSGSAPKTVSISFNVNNVLIYNNDAGFPANYFRPGTPGVSLTIE
jgi:hypothetical protein